MDKYQRSITMSKIRKTDTRPELCVRKYLFKEGLRYRLYNKKLPGNPDIVLPKYKAIIFVNGCFWHAHENCKYNRLPKSRIEYWHPKILGNVERDKRNVKNLKNLGWRTFIVWECELSKQLAEKNLKKLIKKLTKRLNEIY